MSVLLRMAAASSPAYHENMYYVLEYNANYGGIKLHNYQDDVKLVDRAYTCTQ